MSEFAANEKQAEQTIKAVSQKFKECVKEIYKGVYPDLEFAIYVTHPKYDNAGHAESTLSLILTSDSIDDSVLEYKMEEAREPIVYCVQEKLSNKYPDAIFSHAGTPVGTPDEAFDLDKSQFLEVIESSLKNDWTGLISGKLGESFKIMRNADWLLKTFTETDIKALFLSVCSRLGYHLNSLIEYFNEHAQEIIERVMDLLSKLSS